MENSTCDITRGNITKQLLIFFWPIFVGNMFQQFYSLTDSVIIGKFVGSSALAAIGSTSTITSLFINLFIGIGSGATVIISQYFGASNIKKVKSSINSSIIISLFSGIIITFIGLTFTDQILAILNVPESIYVNAKTYLRVYFLASIASIFYNMISGILRAMGNSKSPLYMLMKGTVLNVFLDILFIVVLHKAVLGAAIATSLSMYFTAILAFIELHKFYRGFKIKNIFSKASKQLIKKILKIGIPIGIESAMYNISNVLIQSSYNTLSDNTIAAMNIHDRLDGFAWMILGAFSISITTFVGQNYGAKKYDRIMEAIKKTYIIVLPIMLTFSFVVITNIGFLAHLFVKDPNVIAINRITASTVMPFYFLYIPVMIYSGTIKGTGESLKPMLITMFGTCLLRVVWVLTVFKNTPTLETLLTCYPLTWGITSLIFIVYFYFYKKKLKIKMGLAVEKKSSEKKA